MSDLPYYVCEICGAKFLYSSDHLITCPCHPANWERPN